MMSESQSSYERLFGGRMARSPMNQAWVVRLVVSGALALSIGLALLARGASGAVPAAIVLVAGIVVLAVYVSLWLDAVLRVHLWLMRRAWSTGVRTLVFLLALWSVPIGTAGFLLVLASVVEAW